MSIVGEWQPAGEFNPNNCKEGDRFLFCYKNLKPIQVIFGEVYNSNNEKTLGFHYENKLGYQLRGISLQTQLENLQYFAKINPPC